MILSLRSKTRQRATPLLPTYIYTYPSGGTISCALPCTTKKTISTSISQKFRSWVAIFHLHQPMAFLSHSSYSMPGLASLMNVLFFHLSSSDSLKSSHSPEVLWSIWESHQTFWSLPLKNVTWHSGTWPYTVTPSMDLTLHQYVTLLTNLTYLPIWTLLQNFGRFP